MTPLDPKSESRDRRRAMLRTAMGPTIGAALSDPAVIEVMVNPDGRLWLDRQGQGRVDTGHRLAAAEVERIIQLLSRLPGLGPRSARKAGLALITRRVELLEPLARALTEANERIVTCDVCGSIDSVSPC